MGMIDERHDVPQNVTRRVTVEYFLTDEPGPKIRTFVNEWYAKEFVSRMLEDPTCDTVHIKRER